MFSKSSCCECLLVLLLVFQGLLKLMKDGSSLVLKMILKAEIHYMSFKIYFELSATSINFSRQ